MFRLSLNTGFAVNRYSEPKEWIKIIGRDCNVRYAQMTADLLNPSLSDEIIEDNIRRIQQACEEYNVRISSTFTGAFTRVNHLAHPDKKIQQYWISWFKRYADISKAIGSDNMGSHFGIFTAKDNNDPILRSERRLQNIENWHEIGKHAKKIGLKYLSWEPMSISREQGETQEEAKKLQHDVNKNSPISFYICLDVDHGDIMSKNLKDTDPYSWLATFAKDSPLIHLKQSQKNKGGHYPFTKEHNSVGKIIPEKVINTLINSGRSDADMILELSFRERNPIDQTVIQILQESVAYWRDYIRE